MLSDSQIKHAMRWRNLTIEPFDIARLQGASLDVTLGDALQVLKPGLHVLNPRKDVSDEFELMEISTDGWDLMPGEFALGTTVEHIGLGPGLVGKLEGKSSLGRLGLLVHATAGFLDPEFHGQVTLEMTTSHNRGIRLFPGMPIGQIAFDNVRNVARPYTGKYVGQRGPTVSQYHRNWDPLESAWR